MLSKKEAQINNQSIINEFQKNKGNNNNIAVVSAEAEKIFKLEITEPFIEMLKVLIQNGANPNAYILKLKQYRDDLTTMGLT